MLKPHTRIPALTEQDIKRFWGYVDKTPGQGPQGECWRWTGGHTKAGYGLTTFRDRSYRVTRVAYSLQYGQDPYGYLVCHSCDYPPCVRREHLSLGTHQTNVDDAKARGRLSTGDLHWVHRMPERISRGAKHAATLNYPQIRGERNHRAQLTNNQVAKIKEQIRQGYTTKEIATRLGCGKSIIGHIKAGRSWTHIK